LKSKVSRNIFLYGIGDFIVNGVSAFLFIPLYIKFLNTENYGVLNILNNNLTLFAYIFQFGIISAFSRLYHLKKIDDSEKEYTTFILSFHFFYSIILFLIYWVFKSYIVGWLSPAINSNSFIIYYPLLMAFLGFIPSLYYIYLRMEEKVNIFVQYQILSVTLVLILLSISYLFYEINLISILASFLFSNFAIWLIVIFNLNIIRYFKIDFSDIYETLSFGFPIFVGYIAYFFISKYNIIILQKYITLEEMGRFSMALQIAAIPSLISIAIIKALQPLLFSSISDGELKDKAQILHENYKIFMIWLVGCVIFSIDFLFDLFMPTSYVSIIPVTKYLLLINLVYIFSVIENTILLYKLKSKIILLTTVISSLLNVFLCNILIQKFSVNGVLVSMLISYTVNFSLEVYFSNKIIRLNYSFKTILTSLFIILFYIFVTSSSLLTEISINKLLFSTSCVIFITIYSAHVFKKKYYYRKNNEIN
jgi:O-antigen/teichoic acid export membrane protein